MTCSNIQHIIATVLRSYNAYAIVDFLFILISLIFEPFWQEFNADYLILR